MSSRTVFARTNSADVAICSPRLICDIVERDATITNEDLAQSGLDDCVGQSRNKSVGATNFLNTTNSLGHDLVEHSQVTATNRLCNGKVRR
jgi:hypothetical protein